MPRIHAIAHPGLEPVVARELKEAGLRVEIQPGAVVFEADPKQVASLARQLRTPDRLLLEIGRGPARSYEELAALVRKADWGRFLHPRTEVELSVSSKRSKLHHRDALARKAGFAIQDALRGAKGPAPRGSQLPQRVQLRLEDDEARLAIDVGGELLHRRGWRQETVKAPLRENLAASLLMVAGWQGDEALYDPFCGSGTLPIEAALLAAGRSPFVGRRLACEGWPGIELPPPSKGRRVEVPILGSDRDARSLGAASENARRAGVDVEWRQLDIDEIEPPAPTGLVVTNPPYGRRLGEDVAGVYVAFGRALRARFGGWRVLFLCPGPDLAARVHKDARRLTFFSNGGVKVGLYAFSL